MWFGGRGSPRVSAKSGGSISTNGQTYERVPTNTGKEGASTVAEFGIDAALRKEMEAREKLQEAQYFLNKIKRLEDKARVRASEDEFRKRNLSLRANLSAFILAWESIPDILLYDFA